MFAVCDLGGLCGAAGAEPATWPLPLTREGLAQAAKEPVLQPMPTNLHKRPADEPKAPVSAAPQCMPVFILSYIPCARQSCCGLTLWCGQPTPAM